jgi:branched-subunit amino acid aminotransferase/4-amino-4-deoxychorismate lyase
MIFPILKKETDILKLLRSNMPPCSKDYLCFFSSHLKAFITDPLYMSIPLEDKIIHRGYAIFETTKIFGNKVYQLDKHLDRFTKGIKKIELTSIYSYDEMRDIIVRMSSLARAIEPKEDIEIRYYYSAGLGNLSIFVNDNYYSFYAVAYRTNFSLRPVGGINEIAIPMEEVKKNISSSKTTNYIINSLVSKKARENGGYMGIMLDENGSLLECPTSNVAFLLKDGSFSVPPFDKTLVGTTIIRVLNFVENDLIPNGLVTKVVRDYVNVENFADVVQEAMNVGGDFALPILKINGVTISEDVGDVTKRIQQFLANDKVQDEVSEDIPVFEDLNYNI